MSKQQPSDKRDSKGNTTPGLDTGADAAKARLAATGRNDACPCGSGKKFKKCHMLGDEAAAAPPVVAPDAPTLVLEGWRLFEQRRPGAAEKEFRRALELNPAMPEARVGIGMARLSAGDNDVARTELQEVVKTSEALAAQLRKDGIKDAFTRTEAQPYIRASHALGCLAYDQERYDDTLSDLEHVYSIDEGPVGTEARLIAAKTLVKVGRPAEAVPLLEVASGAEGAASRAQMGLALAHFAAGNTAAAKKSLGQALDANQYLAAAVLGQLRARTDRTTGAAAGSREEALTYAQTYGDVWTEDGKKFLKAALATRNHEDEAADSAP